MDSNLGLLSAKTHKYIHCSARPNAIQEWSKSIFRFLFCSFTSRQYNHWQLYFPSKNPSEWVLIWLDREGKKNNYSMRYFYAMTAQRLRAFKSAMNAVTYTHTHQHSQAHWTQAHYRCYSVTLKFSVCAFCWCCCVFTSIFLPLFHCTHTHTHIRRYIDWVAWKRICLRQSLSDDVLYLILFLSVQCCITRMCKTTIEFHRIINKLLRKVDDSSSCCFLCFFLSFMKCQCTIILFVSFNSKHFSKF